MQLIVLVKFHLNQKVSIGRVWLIAHACVYSVYDIMMKYSSLIATFPLSVGVLQVKLESGYGGTDWGQVALEM